MILKIGIKMEVLISYSFDFHFICLILFFPFPYPNGYAIESMTLTPYFNNPFSFDKAYVDFKPECT